MDKFLIKISTFFIFTIVFFIIGIFIYEKSLDYQDNKDSLFVWGDSQIDQGINLKRLSRKSNMKVYSTAAHGAGLYDFLSFVSKIKDSSKILISCSSTFILRNKTRDRNEGGPSLFAIKNMLVNGYSLCELKTIFNNNLKIRPIIKSYNSLYPLSEKFNPQEKLCDLNKNYTNLSTSYLFDKQNLYYIGLSKLISKHCNISIIVFPMHPSLKSIEEQSDYKKIRNRFYNKVASLIQSNIDTINLDHSKQIMYDYTHLNSFGANQVTDLLSKKLTIKKNQMILFL